MNKEIPSLKDEIINKCKDYDEVFYIDDTVKLTEEIAIKLATELFENGTLKFFAWKGEEMVAVEFVHISQ